MKRRLIGVTTGLFLAAAAWVVADTSVSGRWEMTVKGPAAHGDMPATLVLSQSEARVTGTFSAHGNEHKVSGSFKDGTLQLETTDTPADQGISFSAKLADDGTLSGFLSSPMGDMKWTASRSKDK